MSIKQQGGVFGRNPTFNDVTIEGQLTFDGDIDINSDLKVDGDLDVTGSALIGTTTANTTYAPKLYTESALGDGNGGILIGSYKPSATFLDFSGGAPAVHRIANDGGNLYFETDTNQDGTFDTVGAHFTSVGNLAFESGKGIDFSATAQAPGSTSELLDDYEEGVFTPEVADASTGGNQASGGTFSGRYTKIGNRVFCQIILVNIATVGMTATNGIFIRALPFTAYSGSNMYSPATILKSAITSTEGTLVGLVNINSTTMSINNDVSGVAGATAALVSQISSGGGDIYTSFFYETAL